MTEPCRLIIHPLNRVVSVREGTTVLDAIREAEVQIESICGGKGQCGKCRVLVEQGTVKPSGQASGKFLSPEEIQEGFRLACQCRLTGDAAITIPVESRIDSPKILFTAEPGGGPFNPAAGKYLVQVSREEDLGSAFCSIRLTGYTGARPAVSEEVCRAVAAMDAPLTGIVSETGGYPEVIGVEPGDTTSRNFGLALDLGTTTVVGLLVDLPRATVVARASALNRQITYGEELITRISFTRDPHGLQKLQAAAVASINEVLSSLLASAKIQPGEITDVCLGGNTVMNHLLAGKDIGHLEMADARVSPRPLLFRAGDAGISVHPGAWCYCLPNVSRFVGGDAVGDVIASGMHESEDLSLLVDLGTNGEMILGNRQWLASVSCASGPAFEGAGITFGMRAMRGAIEHLTIDPLTCEASFSVIGGVPPRGICGSGIIDAGAEMFAAGIIDTAGKMVVGSPQVREGRDGPEYVLAPSDRTTVGRDIVITQRDMNYLMDSKAAACGAVGVLLKKYRISIQEISHLYLAGAFGAFADVKNVVRFGILPEFPESTVHPIGNGSLSGAFATLLSMEKRMLAERIAQGMVYIDLLIDTDFIEEYQAAIYIPGRRELFPSYYERERPEEG